MFDRVDLFEMRDCRAAIDVFTEKGVQKHVSCRVLELLGQQDESITDFSKRIYLDRERAIDRLKGYIRWSLYDVVMVARAYDVPVESLLPKE